MKFVQIFLCLSTINLIRGERLLEFKVVKVDANSSLISLYNQSVAWEEIGDEKFYAHVLLYARKPVKRFFMNITALHRPTVNDAYKRFFYFEAVDLCNEPFSWVPLMGEVKKWVERDEKAREIFHACPYSELIVNYTFPIRLDKVKKDHILIAKDYLQPVGLTPPNGEYRIDAKWYNNKDDNILTLTIDLFFKLHESLAHN